MRETSMARTLAVLGVGVFVTAILSAAAPVPSAGQQQQKAPAGSDVPEGYVLVNQETLRQLVHDEVARQLQDFFAQVRREQQQRAAVARLESISSIPAMLCSEIALYKLQHNDQVPTVEQIGDGFKFLMLQTDAAGRPSDGPGSVGPYLHSPVVNPITGKSKVAPLGKATAEAGWSYEPETGRVKTVLPRQLESKLKGRIDQRVVEFVDAGQ